MGKQWLKTAALSLSLNTGAASTPSLFLTLSLVQIFLKFVGKFFYFKNQARPNVLKICLEIFQNYLSKWGIKYVWELSTNTFKPEVLSKYFLYTIANSAEML